MSHILKVLFIALSLTTTACKGQQIVQSARDAKKLQENKQQFVNKPFRILLAQVKPEIKYVFGNPDSKTESLAGTNIKLFFAGKSEYGNMLKAGQNPTGILVSFVTEKDNTRKPIPVGGINITKDALLEEYGDMIVRSVYVTGDN